MSLFYRIITSLARRSMMAGVVLGVVLLTAQSGCVQRRMTIRSNPPGAMVYVDDYELGPTPVSTDFTYYGTRKIRIVKDGYETLTVMQPVPTPWYQVPPADFISENFVPGQIRDQRMFDYQLKPQMVVPTEQLLARADGLRRDNMVMPAGAVMPQGVGSGHQMQPVGENALPGTIPGPNPYPQQNIAPQPNMYQPPNGFSPPNSNPLPNTTPQSNPYFQPNTSIPPGTAMPGNVSPGTVPSGNATQPNAFQQPNLLTPPSLAPQSDIGGQGVHQLPPR